MPRAAEVSIVMPYLPLPMPSRLSYCVGSRRRVGRGVARVHQRAQLAEDGHRGLVLEGGLRGAGAAAVAVVDEELVGRGQPGFEVPRVEDEARAAARGLQCLGVGEERGQRGRGIGRVETRLREGVLVVVQDRRRDGEGQPPLHAVHLPVGERAGQVVARGVLGCVHAGLDRQERAGVDGRLRALVLQHAPRRGAARWRGPARYFVQVSS